MSATDFKPLLPKDWRQQVARAYVTLRKHDQTIPDEVLDLMRAILYAADGKAIARFP